MTRRWALAPLIVVSLFAYAQVVSGSGLLVWVTPAVAIGYGVVTAIHVAARTATARALAWAALVVAVLVWSVIVNLLSGDTAGPVARASLIVGLCSGAMAALVRTRWPASALIPGLLMFAGALALGGSGAPVFVVALVAAAALWLLLRLAPYRWTDFQDGRRGVQTLVLFLLGVGVAMLVTAVTSPALDDPWMLPGIVIADDVAPTPEPTPTPTITASPSPTPTPTATATSDAADPDPVGDAIVRTFLRVLLPAAITVAVVLTVLGLLALFLALLWRASVALTWSLARRKLARGTPSQRIIGAWDWVRLRLTQAGMELPPAASPDAVATDASTSGIPTQAADDLAAVASLAARAGYVDGSAELADHDAASADEAWRHARAVERHLRRGRSLRTWWRLTARRPDWRSLSGTDRAHAGRQSVD